MVSGKTLCFTPFSMLSFSCLSPRFRCCFCIFDYFIYFCPLNKLTSWLTGRLTCNTFFNSLSLSFIRLDGWNIKRPNYSGVKAPGHNRVRPMWAQAAVYRQTLQLLQVLHRWARSSLPLVWEVYRRGSLLDLHDWSTCLPLLRLSSLSLFLSF